MPPIRVGPRELQEFLGHISAKAGTPRIDAGFSARATVRPDPGSIGFDDKFPTLRRRTNPRAGTDSPQTGTADKISSTPPTTPLHADAPGCAAAAIGRHGAESPGRVQFFRKFVVSP